MSAAPLDPVVIGLDVGTTAVKAAAFAPGASGGALARREHGAGSGSTLATADPEALVAAAEGALGDCVAATGGAPVAAVALSAAMHALVALDRDRQPMGELLTWADGRAADQARALHRSGAAAGLHDATGAPVHPMTPLTKLLWFREHDPSTWRTARAWVGVKELLLLALTGELAVDVSSASGTGLLDMASRRWSAEALKVAGLTAERLAPLLPVTATLPLAPAVAHRVGLPPGTPVVVGGADGPLANVGTGAVERGTANLSLGTSGAVRVVVGAPGVDADRSLFCYALTEDTWVLGGATSNGGHVLRWARQRFGHDGQGASDAAALAAAALVAPGCDGLLQLPYLLPERAPRWDPDLPGAYLGVRVEHGPAHFLRAAVEGVALHLRTMIDALDRVEPVTAVRATGGAFEAPLWRRVVAATAGRPTTVVTDGDGSARGAAALALLALGRAGDLADAAGQLGVLDTGAVEPVEPLEAEVYDGARTRLPALVRALLPVADVFERSAPPPSDH